jgi:hypothetical protein
MDTTWAKQTLSIETMIAQTLQYHFNLIQKMSTYTDLLDHQHKCDLLLLFLLVPTLQFLVVAQHTQRLADLAH